MKVALYCRVSTEQQHNDKQEEMLREYCSRMNYEIFNIYKDVISGTTTSRKEFNNMLGDMRNFKFKAILVTKLDRLGRSLQHLLSLINEFSIRGIDFIAVTQNIDTTSASGKLQLQIMGAFAEYERNIISERTKEGLRKRKDGKRGKDKKPRKRLYWKKPILNNKGGSIAY
jgi:DNA invertase Pin-like site-specific DNA recombinase